MPGGSRPAMLRLSLACEVRQVRQAVRAAHQFLADHGCDPELLMGCELALAEGCNNAIEYCREEARQCPVILEVICDATFVELRVTDHTAGFEWPKKAELPDPESEGGRGLYLIQSLMDEAVYLRGDGQNLLVLRKNRLAPDDGAVPLSAREQEIARDIQQSLLHKEIPEIPGFGLAAFGRSAHQVGGDFYDVMPLKDGAALLVVADVMGKGVVAALFAAILRTAVRALEEFADRPAELLRKANRLLYDELSGAELFITAQLVYFKPAERRLVVASAGHCPLMVANGAGSGVKTFSPDGMPLGISPDTAFASEVVVFPEKSRVLLYTDGLTEAMNAEGQRFGQEQLLEWFGRAGNPARPAEELKQELAETLGRFQAKTALNDDQTFLIMTG